MDNQNNNPSSRPNKDNKSEYSKELFKELSKTPQSRRMAATAIGFPDQTYMVTQLISDWIRDGKAQSIGIIRCKRSGRRVEKVTTNPDLFVSKSTNQMNLF